MTFDIVFEGGGAKGFGFVGAMLALYENGHRPGRLIGTSSGAITATLLAAGFTPERMLEIVHERTGAEGESRFATFLDPPDVSQLTDDEVKNSQLGNFLRQCDPGVLKHHPFLHFLFSEAQLHLDPADRLSRRMLDEHTHCASLFSLLEFGGWYGGQAFVNWLNEKLESAGEPGYSNCTLIEFYERTKTDLSLVASDASTGEMLVLNHRTAPGCPIVQAVRMSMSFPFIWPEVVWKEEWKTYRKRSLVGHVIADGGLLSNFPIHLFNAPVSADSHINEIMGTDRRNSGDTAGVLGLLLDQSRALEADALVPRSSNAHPWPLLRPLRLLNTMLGAYDRDYIQANDAYICRIPVSGYSVIDFNLSRERLDELITSGYNAMIDHLEKAPPTRRVCPPQSSAATG